LALVLTGIVSVQFGAALAVGLFDDVGAAGAVLLRIVFGALILGVVVRPRWRGRSRADLALIAMFGVVLGVMNLSFYEALDHIPLGIAVTIEFWGPLAVAVIGSRRALDLLWVVLAAAGIVLLAKPGGGGIDTLGLVLAALAGLCWALYIIFGKRLTHLHPGQSVALGMSVAAMVVVPFGLAHAGAALFNPAIVVAGLAVAIFSSALPYSLEMVALRGIPKRTFGVVLSAEPAVGALAGLVILHEHLTGQQWLAIAAIVASAASPAPR